MRTKEIEWINIHDSYPPENQQVLICYRNKWGSKSVRYAKWNKILGTDQKQWWGLDNIIVSFWSHLPQTEVEEIDSRFEILDL